MKRVTSAIALISIMFGAQAALAGDAPRSQAEVNNYTLSKRAPQVRGFLFRPGGHRYDFEYEPYIRRSGPYGNYPDFDQRSFSERVLSDPRFSTTAPSAF